MENEFNQQLNKKFMNPAKFAVEIEKLVKQEKINYIDAIVLYCEETVSYTHLTLPTKA